MSFFLPVHWHEDEWRDEEELHVHGEVPRLADAGLVRLDEVVDVEDVGPPVVGAVLLHVLHHPPEGAVADHWREADGEQDQEGQGDRQPVKRKANAKL